MLRKRLLVVLVLIPIIVGLIALGGLPYLLMVLLFFGAAAYEYARLFRTELQRPAQLLIMGGALLFIAAQQFPALNPHNLLFALAIFAPLVWHLVDYERGAALSGTDFCITVSGIFYLGLIGSYFIAMRALPNGEWWMLIATGAIWFADAGAYACGKLWGRHKMTPRLSPNKTWEGYLGGMAVGTASGAVLGGLLSLGAGPQSLLTWQTGALLSLLVSTLGPLGDLGISMFKRQFNIKDTGQLLPGHGGALDRMDSWLAVVPLAYYFVITLQAMQ